MTNKNKDIRRMGLVLFTIVITLFSLCFISGAGFGSSYLPDVNGEHQLRVPIGSNVSYFIYPQNFDEKILLVKINITDGSNLLVNQLQDYYEVPPNTSSDEIKIELIFSLENNTELIGKKFPVKLDVLSTYKTNETSSIVTFSPLGFSKSFFVIGEPAVVGIPPIIELVLVSTSSSSSSGGGGGSGTTTTKKETPVITENKPVEITTPKTTATNEPETASEPAGTTITEPTNNHNLLIVIIIVGLIVAIGITIIVKKYGEM